VQLGSSVFGAVLLGQLGYGSRMLCMFKQQVSSYESMCVRALLAVC
jgi:hypothetical protein